MLECEKELQNLLSFPRFSKEFKNVLCKIPVRTNKTNKFGYPTHQFTNISINQKKYDTDNNFITEM